MIIINYIIIYYYYYCLIDDDDDEDLCHKGIAVLKLRYPAHVNPAVYYYAINWNKASPCSCYFVSSAGVFVVSKVAQRFCLTTTCPFQRTSVGLEGLPRCCTAWHAILLLVTHAEWFFFLVAFFGIAVCDDDGGTNTDNVEFDAVFHQPTLGLELSPELVVIWVREEVDNGTTPRSCWGQNCGCQRPIFRGNIGLPHLDHKECCDSTQIDVSINSQRFESSHC